MADFKKVKNLINPHKEPDKQFFLDLLDDDKQLSYEAEHLNAVMLMLRAVYINKLKRSIKSAQEEIDRLTSDRDYNAESYRQVLTLKAEIAQHRAQIDTFKPFFDEPYFARMDLIDDQDGYNSYYIGKRGDEGLEIVDWRAPLARRYYQKSRISFSINEFNYKLILRRAIRAKSGKVIDFKNEYLSVKDYLSREEIGGRDEEIIFDPFLREIIKSRKEKSGITDIIETIQEKQYEIITLPEDAEFVVQGIAGSGKTMIMLHRLSYIMYNNEGVKPPDVLVLTPSDSFNSFIDELSAVLELEKVKTTTIESYFVSVLKGQGIMLEGKMESNSVLPQTYLAYVYSNKFAADIEKRLAKIFDGVSGMFSSEESSKMSAEVLRCCTRQTELYEHIKNASLRVRRCVLGEIKEKEGGGLYYTKPFRRLFNCVSDVKEFLELNATDGRMKTYGYFYRMLLTFYKAMKFIRRNGEKICADAEHDLTVLSGMVDREVTDLMRYRINVGGSKVLTYAERIEKRKALKKEIEETISRVKEIDSLFAAVCDYADVLRCDNALVAIGRCEDSVDVVRYFYSETVKKFKQWGGVSTKKLYRCDAYALCLLLVKLGYDLTPKHSFVFIDEGQDISAGEYAVLKAINGRAKFNIFGDLKQNITPFRGLTDWQCVLPQVYALNQNYRNTNQIVEFVSGRLNIDMQAIGCDGSPITEIPMRKITSYLQDEKGLKAVIVSEANYEKYLRKNYNAIRDTGVISKKKINIMTVYESKGLEFTSVAVADGDMTDNEKYIAYTRALKELVIVK
ncbi:MAG: AAA family ATPase [Clostridia bacterium]|nr:AAA family ATPase [Clostridia bacterium]